MTMPADQQEPELDLNFHTDMPVGEILRRTRRHYGQSLEQIEQVLRIRASQLEAIENNEIHKLPGRVYAIGFVRSYSEYLGLDGDKMVHLFKEQSVGRKQARPEFHFPMPASESKVPSLFIIAGVVVGFLLMIGFIAFLLYPERPAQEIPPVPPSLSESGLNEAPPLIQPETAQTAPNAVQTTVQSADSVTTAIEPAKPANRIVLEITDSSWIEIKNASGAAILRQVLKPGDIYLVPDEPGLVMATGNAGGIRVKVDGKEVAPVGAVAQVRRNIRLDPDALVAQGAPVPVAPPVVQQTQPQGQVIPPVPTEPLQPPAQQRTQIIRE